MSDKAPSDLADRFQLRLPDGMRDQLKQAAEASNRSMNAEIVGRLKLTLDKAAGDYNAIGVNALVQRLEATVFHSEKMMQSLYIKLRLQGGQLDDAEELLRALEAYGDDHKMNAAKAIEKILTDQLREKGYLPSSGVDQ